MSVIEGVVNGEPIRGDFIDRFDQQWKKDNEFIKNHTNLWRKKFENSDEPRPKNFGEFWSKPGNSEVDIIKTILRVMRVDSADDYGKTARNICKNIDLLPHLKANLKAISAISFCCVFEGMKRTGSHRGDIHHLVCATNVDIFVSNDSDFSYTFPNVHGDKVLMDFNKFSDYLNTVV